VTPKRYLNPHKVPAGAVRDLLAITRALYGTRKAEGAGPDELDLLERAGKAFGHALSMAHVEPDTIGSRAAWSWAEKGWLCSGKR